MKVNFFAAVGQGEVIRVALVIVQEVVLDYIPSVAEAKYEILVSEMGIVAHQMPHDRTVADIDHRFGDRF